MVSLKVVLFWSGTFLCLLVDSNQQVLLSCGVSVAGPSELETLDSLNETIAELQRKLAILEKPVTHFLLPPLEVNWWLGKQYCENLGLKLCSHGEIFPHGLLVPALIGVQSGNHWVPVSDAVNEWTEVGDFHAGGIARLHNAFYGFAPTWANDDSPLKGHLFCCR